ncbi:MAG: hypothetical protein KF774_11850 [Planctomyces sp.]|nr:hypothetical protein [Planctomyces sp.]
MPAALALLLSGCHSPLHELQRGGRHVLYSRNADDLLTARTARSIARRDLKRISHAGGCVSGDFASGYQQAYVDVALGGSGVTPAVPPRSYWGMADRSAAGHRRVQDWFDGYGAGADEAWTVFGDYNVVATSEPPLAHCEPPHGGWPSGGWPTGAAPAAGWAAGNGPARF